MADNAQKIQSLNNQIASTEASVASAQKNLTTEQNNLTRNQRRLADAQAAGNTANIALFTKLIADNQAAIDRYTTSIENYNAKLTQARADLAVLQASDTSTTTAEQQTTSQPKSIPPSPQIEGGTTNPNEDSPAQNLNKTVTTYPNGVTETVQTFPNTAVADPVPAQVSTSTSPDLTTTPERQRFLEANTGELQNVAPDVLTPEQQRFLDANTGEVQNAIPDVLTPEQQRLLEANEADAGSIAAEQSKVDSLLDLYSQKADGTIPTDAENQAAVEQFNSNSVNGITTSQQDTYSQATRQDVENAKAKGDWRVRISLGPNANYFYRANGQEGIMYPLKATDGVIFPYTPTISVAYTANYDQQALTHTNYKTTHYINSSVDSISITCEFTAQDTYEANYLLATIHFFRSLTKMFYGQDENPTRGTPPPLCYLHGYGDFQFDKHPMVISGFTYSLPADVDYIRTDTSSFVAGVTQYSNKKSNDASLKTARGAPTRLVQQSQPVNFSTSQVQPTYVPTKISLTISAHPVVSRYDVSNNFSLKDYASGRLLRGSKQKYGGFW